MSNEIMRNELKNKLSRLIPSQFNEFLYEIKAPQDLISSSQAEQLKRVLDLLTWAESPTGIGLDKLKINCYLYILVKKLSSLSKEEFFKIVHKIDPIKKLTLEKKSLENAIDDFIKSAQSGKNPYNIEKILNAIDEIQRAEIPQVQQIEDGENIIIKHEDSTQTENIEYIIEEITQCCKKDNLLILIGSGINLEDEINSQFIQEVKDGKKEVTDGLKYPPSDERISLCLSKAGLHIDRLLGFPCELCPVDFEQRPHLEGSSCPVIENIDRFKGERKQIVNEAKIIFSKLNIRCQAEYLIRSKKRTFEESLENLFYAEYQPNSIQNNIANFIYKIKGQNQDNKLPAIIVTNYDYGLEKALLDKKLNVTVNVLSYSSVSNLEDSQYNFIRYNQNYLAEVKNKEDCKSYFEEELTKTNNIIEFKDDILIIKLYGGSLYNCSQQDRDKSSFAINKYYENSTLKLPSLHNAVKLYCENSNLLLLGFSANDREVIDIINFLGWENPKKRKKAWLIHESEVGKINKNIYDGLGVDINITPISWSDFLEQLCNYQE